MEKIFNLEQAKRFYALLQEYLDMESVYADSTEYLEQKKEQWLEWICNLHTNGDEMPLDGKLGWHTKVKTGTRIVDMTNIVPNVWISCYAFLDDEQIQIMKELNQKVLEFLDEMLQEKGDK